MKTNKLLIWSVVCLVLSAFTWANWDAPSIAKVMGGKAYVLLQMDDEVADLNDDEMEALMEGNHYSFDADSRTLAIVFDPEQTSKKDLVQRLSNNFNVGLTEVESESSEVGCPVGAWSIFMSQVKDFLCLRQPQLQK